MDYANSVFDRGHSAPFIIGVEGSFGTETRYGRDNKSRGVRALAFLSSSWQSLRNDRSFRVAYTSFIFSLVVLRSRDVVLPPRHCLVDNINGIRITGEKERERESEVSDTIVSKSFLATPVETLLFHTASASLLLLSMRE